MPRFSKARSSARFPTVGQDLVPSLGDRLHEVAVQDVVVSGALVWQLLDLTDAMDYSGWRSCAMPAPYGSREHPLTRSRTALILLRA
jgi:hypothetical protein